MRDLVPGANLALPEGAVSVEVSGPFDLSALIAGDDGKVGGDEDFVFYNQPSAPGARLQPGTIVVDPRRLRAGAGRVTVVVSSTVPGTPLGGLPVPTLRVVGSGGAVLARFAPPPLASETVVLLVEIYRRGASWKLRAIGQGYADGLAGLARDFGVDVTDDGSPAPAGRPPGSIARPNPPAPSRPARPPAAVDHLNGLAGQVSSRRAGRGLPPIMIDGRLTAAAQAHAAAGRTRDLYWTALWAVPFSSAGLTRFTTEVVLLTNAQRTTHGLRPLADDPRLASAAQAYSEDMVARRFYSHTSPEGTQPWDRAAAAGSTHRGIGENIACGQRTPAEVVRGWMDSPPHRANILKPDFTHIGIGFQAGGQAGTYWTQLFGMSP